MRVTEINSLQNDRVKQLVRLQESRHRRKTGLFTLETRREIQRAMAAGYQAKAVYALKDWSQEDLEGLDQAEQYQVSESVLKKITYREHPEGGLVVFQSKAPLTARRLPQGDFYVVLDGLEKPGNLGAILRTVDGVGVDGVLIASERAVDLYHPHVVRASTATVFSLPIVVDEPEAILEALQDQGCQIVTASPDANFGHTEKDWSQPCALVLGAEAEGVSKFWKKHADDLVKIQMNGAADSLNVSVSAAVMLFEARRQRG